VESIQTAISELDRMHQDIFQNTQSSTNEISHAHQSSLLDLKDALVNSLSSGETAHQKQLIQLNDMNQESLQRIVEVLEKLDVKINGNQQKSGWLGAPNFKLVR
jgi:argininosuccinate lyase